MSFLSLDSISRVAKFFRVIDDQGNLSLTNIALVAALVRTLMLPQLTVHDLGAFVAAVTAYQFKRYASPPGNPEDPAPLEAAINELQSKVSALQVGQSFRKP